jgi:hypothetical protein
LLSTCRGFAAEKGAAGLGARHGYALHDRRDALWIDLAARDVVGHEQRFGPAHDQVVDDHADQIEADGVVAVQRLGDGDLCADPVGRRSQHRMLALRERAGVEQSREAADASHDLGTSSLGDPFPHQFDSPVARLNVHPGRRVCRLLAHWSLSQPDLSVGVRGG